MSNVIKKVFHTDKGESEVNQATDKVGAEKGAASEGKENIVQEGKDKIGNLLHRGGSEHQGHHGLAGFGGEKAKEAEGTASGVTGVHGAGAGTTAGQASGAAAASG